MLPSAVSDSRVHNILPNKIETDFQFSRASAATRVNHQGLIEEVGYFGPELVQNGDFSELGPELVTNGGFDTDSNWTKGTGWSINDGKATYQGTISSNLRQYNVLVSGKTHKLVFEVTSNTSDGNLKLAGETVSGGGLNVPETVGVHTVYFVATGSTTNFTFRVTNNTTGVLEIDNVSVKQVDPDDDWTLGTGWSYGDGIVSSDGSQSGNSDCTQNLLTPTGKTYKITYTISQYSAGSVFIRLASGNVTTTQTSTGTFTEILNGAGGTQVKIRANSTFVGTISNISVVEVIGDKPRLDYDPTNPTCPHLLLEPQSTNLVPFSEDFSQWNTFNITAETNTAINPKGTSGCYRIFVDNTTNSNLFLSTASIGTSYTISIYAKSNNANKDNFQLRIGDSRSSVFTATSEWQRFTYSATATGSNTFAVAIFTSSGTVSSDILIFGAQVETTAYATSYIPTAGAAETRVAETCNSGGNADTFNDAEGVLMLEASSDNTNSIIWSISDGSNNNAVSLYYGNQGILCDIFSSVGIRTIIATFPITFRVNMNKFAVKYKSNDIAIWVNGVKSAVNTQTIALSGLNTLGASYGSGSFPFYGKVKSLATYNRALTDTELYTITSTQYSAYSGMVAALGNYTIPC